MTPAQTYQIPDGSRVFIFSCESCAAPAAFGFDAHIRAALAAKSKDEAVRLAGRWWCGMLSDGSGYCRATGETSVE